MSRTGTGCWKAFLALVAGVSVCLGTAKAEDVTLVVNGQTGDAALTQQEMQDVFLGKKTTWSNGSAIVPVVLSGGDVHGQFLSTIVNKTESQFSIYWKKLAFSGKAVEPKSMASEADLLKFVGTTKGAVGYVSATAAAGAEASGAKIVTKK